MKLNLKEIQSIELKMLESIKDILESENIAFFLRAGSLLGAVRHNGFIPWDTDIDIEIPINKYYDALCKLEKQLPNCFVLSVGSNMKNYGQLFARVRLKGVSDDIIHIDLFPMVGITDNIKKQKSFINRVNRLNFLYNTKKDSTKLFRSKKSHVTFIRCSLWLFLHFIPSCFFERRIKKLLLRYDFEKSVLVVNPFSKYKMRSVFPKSFYSETIGLKFENMLLQVPHQYDRILKQLYGDYMIEKTEHNIKTDSFTIDLDEIIYSVILEKSEECNEKEV